MAKVCVDTSWLIRFSDPDKDDHACAVEYFRHCFANGHDIFLSTLVISEFEVRQDSSTLPLQYFNIIPFNYEHATLSAKFQKFILDQPALEAPRVVVRNDIAILAQAHIEGCNTILTQDGGSLAKWADRLRTSGLSSVYPILLKDGYKPDLITDPSQPGLL